MKPVRVAIVGAGHHMTDKLIPPLKLLQDEGKIHLKIICQRDQNKLLENRKIFGIPEAIIGLENIQDVDCLIAAGPPDLHQATILHGLNIGAHVFVEKPHIISPDTANEIANIKNEYPKIQVMIGYNFIFLDTFKSISGKINQINISCTTNGIYVNDTWGNLEKMDRALQSVVVHPVAVVLSYFNYPNEIVVENKSVEEAIILTIKFIYPNGINTIEYSSNGKCFTFDVIAKLENGKEINIDGKQEKPQSYYNEFNTFFHHIQNDTYNPVNLELGLNISRCLNRIKELSIKS